MKRLELLNPFGHIILSEARLPNSDTLAKIFNNIIVTRTLLFLVAIF